MRSLISADPARSAGGLERVVLVGAGGFGETWWPTLDAYRDRVQVVAAIDPDPLSRKAAAEHFGLEETRVSETFDGGILERSEATVVIDSSPARYRRSNALTCRRSGVHLIAAKPLGLSLREATDIVDTSWSAGSTAVAQQMRYFPCFLALRRMLAAGEFGGVVSVSVRMALDGRGWVPGTQWRLAMDHPLLLEAGIHHFDLLRWCLGRELRVVGAMEWNPLWSPFRTGAAVSALLRTTDGVPVRYEATFAPGPHTPAIRFDSGWRIECADACLTVVDGAVLADDVVVHPAVSSEPVPLEDLNRELFGAWLAARDAGAEPPFGGLDNLRSMALLDEAVTLVECPATAVLGEPAP